MNPFLIILILIGTVFLWFILSFTFPIIGKLFKRIFDDAKYNILKEDKKEDEKR